MRIKPSVLLIIGLLFNINFANAYNICDAHMINAAKKYQVPLPILYAVSMTEAGVRQIIQPYALNIDGKTHFPTSKEEALSAIKRAKKRGARYIDVGCMQINIKYHGKNFASTEDMLNPKLNINYAAQFLKHLYDRTHSWTVAVARYHASDQQSKEQKRYICKVIKNLISTGFGESIKDAKHFCAHIH